MFSRRPSSTHPEGSRDVQSGDRPGSPDRSVDEDPERVSRAGHRHVVEHVLGRDVVCCVGGVVTRYEERYSVAVVAWIQLGYHDRVRSIAVSESTYVTRVSRTIPRPSCPDSVEEVLRTRVEVRVVGPREEVVRGVEQR